MIAENHFAAVAALDLEPIRNKLMAAPAAAGARKSLQPSNATTVAFCA